ncbi:acyl-CoA synthetase [Robiginitalea sediminis]|uniref:acyl-CoA synthetase n=1 Tax=Robiginitalea sediminis TaxID=1982593 RepID=UPI000B4A91E8|nr:acyl-CoA synthetase [Robiginitalea sediminis]
MSIPLVDRAAAFASRTAIREDDQKYSYSQLLERSEAIARHLLGSRTDLQEARIAFLVPAGFDYACVQWGIWRAGGIAVPLCEKHPLPSMEYVLDDTDAELLLCTEAFAGKLAPLQGRNGLDVLRLENLGEASGPLPEIGPDRRAMILYTSGTTGPPKGVVTTHANITTQITTLVSSWEWEQEDEVLNVLPLHHVHGIVNMLCCALWSGACCRFLPRFEPDAVFEIFTEGEVNVFMAVPTIYYKLIAHYDSLPTSRQKQISEQLRGFRLMVSGSAALPVSVLEQWRDISSHTLLERYGMTEMGMAISNPYRGERRPGHIGQALPGVRIRLADENDLPVPPGEQGEIQVKGDNVFSEYWGKPEATQKAFTSDGWFRTGDMALLDQGSYRILGRNSVDIIKSGGYKISALEIEEVLRTHPAVKDCGVVGLPNVEWGEIIGAAIIPDGAATSSETLVEWLGERLPSYKVPRVYITVEDLPRNVLGKVTKNELKSLFPITGAA